MPFIIDGYNLLRLVQNTDKQFESIAEARLCYVISRYFRLVAQKGVIVFDGTGPPDKGRFDGIANLEVTFSGPDADADSVIEDKIRAATAPKALTVVSTDRRLRAAARAANANAVTSKVFWDELQTRLSRQHKKLREPAGKRKGITESETEQWLEFFGLRPGRDTS